MDGRHRRGAVGCGGGQCGVSRRYLTISQNRWVVRKTCSESGRLQIPSDVRQQQQQQQRSEPEFDSWKKQKYKKKELLILCWLLLHAESCCSASVSGAASREADPLRRGYSSICSCQGPELIPAEAQSPGCSQEGGLFLAHRISSNRSKFDVILLIRV